jgi:DNA-binding NarL/FixJ family response regulator
LQVLIVEDDALVARSLKRSLRQQAVRSVLASSLADASQILEDEEMLGAMILDLHLPDGSGLTLLEHGERIPTMVLTGYPTEDAMRRAVAHGALFMQKPARADEISSFLRWARGEARPLLVLQKEVRALAEHIGLTPRERDVLMSAARGMDQTEIADFLGVKETTVATHVRRIREQADARGFAAVVRRVHRGVFGPSVDRDGDD